MGKPAARITDFHVCPMVCPGPVPHVGGPIIQGSPNVLTGNIPQARVGDKAMCSCAVDTIVSGSSGVFVNNKPAARIADSCAHGGKIVLGLPTVLIGGGGGGGGSAAGAAPQINLQATTLKNAAKEAQPFCEICEKMKNAVAR